MYRHGLPERGKAVIAIDLRGADGELTLTFTDNGSGLPADSRDGTGFLLIRALCAQLNAELTIRSPASGSGGVSVTVTVPVRARRS